MDKAFLVRSASILIKIFNVCGISRRFSKVVGRVLNREYEPLQFVDNGGSLVGYKKLERVIKVTVCDRR